MYKQIVGSLKYLCNNMPDITYVVNIVDKLMSESKKSHLVVTKRVFRYIKGTMKLGFLFTIVVNEGEIHQLLRL